MNKGHILLFPLVGSPVRTNSFIPGLPGPPASAVRGLICLVHSPVFSISLLASFGNSPDKVSLGRRIGHTVMNMNTGDLILISPYSRAASGCSQE